MDNSIIGRKKEIEKLDRILQSKKSEFLTMITTYGVEKNKYANLLVRNEVRMDDLFD